MIQIIGGINLIDNTFKWLQVIYYVSTILSVVFIAWQAKTFIDDSKRNDRRLRKQKAIELAEMYEKEILPLISIVNGVFKSINMDKDVLNKFEKCFTQFNEQEMKKIVPRDAISTFSEKLHSQECQIQYSGLKFIINKNPSLPTNARRIGSVNNLTVSTATRDHLSKLITTKDLHEFNEIIVSLLNKLESFAMYFNYKVADEEVVYQSLHQSYISIVISLYVKIASINKDPKDKYYTNVIELYNKWNDRYQSKIQAESDLSMTIEKVVHRGADI